MIFCINVFGCRDRVYELLVEAASPKCLFVPWVNVVLYLMLYSVYAEHIRHSLASKFSWIKIAQASSIALAPLLHP